MSVIRNEDQQIDFWMDDYFEFIPSGSDAWLVDSVIDVFVEKCGERMVYVPDEGRPGFNHVVMLKVVIWSMLQGYNSYRRIQYEINNDVVLHFFAAGDTPNYNTIWSFCNGQYKLIVSTLAFLVMVLVELKIKRLCSYEVPRFNLKSIGGDYEKGYDRYLNYAAVPLMQGFMKGDNKRFRARGDIGEEVIKINDLASKLSAFLH